MKTNIQSPVWASVSIPAWVSKTFYAGVVLLLFSLRGLCSDGVTAVTEPTDGSAVATHGTADGAVATPVSRGAYAIPSREALANMTVEQKEARMAEMKARVKEIKAMDKSQLTKQDRRALRAELRSMNKEARAMGYAGGVYLSVGALIIIILLLILILR